MASDRANSRLEYWKSKLIDLSLRNKLVNYRVSRASTAPVVDEVPRVVVERLLAEERSFGFLPKPEEGPAPEGGEEFAPMAEEDLKANHVDSMLQTTLTQTELDKVLYNLYLKSRTSFQEQGIVTLFLAVGMLRWFEDQTSQEERVAPILLLPAVLTRKGVGRPFTLSAAPAEPEVNPSLLRKLKVDFGVEPKLPADGEGLDPDRVLEAFRAVLPEPRWRVLTDMHLGLFSFSKYLMYRDLEDQADTLLRNRTIARLAGEPIDSDQDRLPPSPEDLTRRPPTEVHQILDADSSQQAAVEAVLQGFDLVLQGPPGTGKSQTIANVIAESLANGKTVLFVSEKMAALEVVKKRLDHAGLGDYVLELHSRHAVKREVVAELARCLRRDRTGAPKDTGELDRLIEAREELDRYVAAVHEPFGTGGLTPFDAFGAIAANEPTADLLFEFENPEDVSRDDRAHLTRMVDDLEAARRGLGDAAEHPFRFSRLTSVPRVVELEVAKLLRSLSENARSLQLGLESSAGALGLSVPKTLDETRAHLDLLTHLTRSPGPDPAWVENGHWAGSSTEGRALTEKLRKLAEGRRHLLDTWTEGLFDLAIDDLAARRYRHGTGFLRYLRPSWWKDRQVLATALRPGAEPAPQALIDDLALAVRVRDLGLEIDENSDRGKEMFGRFFKGRQSDWEDLDAVAAWVAGLRKLSKVTPELAAAARQPRDFDDPLSGGNEILGKVTRDLEALRAQLRATELPTAIEELISWPLAALDHPEGIYDQAAWRRALEAAKEKGLAPFIDAAREAGLSPNNWPAVWEKGFAMLYLDRARAERAPLGNFHR